MILNGLRNTQISLNLQVYNMQLQVYLCRKPFLERCLNILFSFFIEVISVKAV